MKGSQRGCALLFVAIVCTAASVCSAGPIQTDVNNAAWVTLRPKANLKDQLYDAGNSNRVVRKRSQHPIISPLVAAEQDYQAPEYDEDA